MPCFVWTPVWRRLGTCFLKKEIANGFDRGAGSRNPGRDGQHPQDERVNQRITARRLTVGTPSMMELKMTKISTSPAAERMRRYRQRRRRGVQYIRIPLHVTEIDQLIHSPIGRWKEDDPRTDAEVVQAAILTLVYGTLDRE